MRNDVVAEKGQKLVEDYYKRRGWEVDDVTKRDNTLPYDIAVRKGPEYRWLKIQVKTTRGPKNDTLTFRTRKSRRGKKVNYEPRDLHMFAFVDHATETMVHSTYARKGYFAFSTDKWEEICVECRL